MKKVLFAGSECYPFVKTGGLGDVMSALPKALVKDGTDVRVILPKYGCIPQKYVEQMEYLTNFFMDCKQDGRNRYVGIFRLVMDGVTYYFIDNEEYFGGPTPYTDMAADIEKFVFFDKAVLAVLPVIGFIPDIIHCHDWQAGLVPVFLHTMFKANDWTRDIRTIITIHNLQFQGKMDMKTMKLYSGLPDYAFAVEDIRHGKDANMLKGGIVYADRVTTVSNTYAEEIKTWEYGEGLEGVVGYYHQKLCGIVNGIDYDVYNPYTDKKIVKNFNLRNVFAGKKANKLALQEELGMEVNADKMVIGLISRLTDQKGLDLIDPIMNRMLDENTQFILIGTGDKRYEEMFRYYENTRKGQVSANIMYSDERARRLYAAADVMLVPSRFEPCGLTQLMAMRYGALPLVRETGGLKDTVEPYNEFEQTGTGFSFDRYDAELLLGTINYAKTVYFTKRPEWNAMIKRAMKKDFSWETSAKDYKNIYEWT